MSALTPSSTPGATSLPRGLQPTDVSPGVLGFLATAFVVVLSIFLILNLVSRMRRIRHRGALEEARLLVDQRAAASREELGGAPGALPPAHEVVRGQAREVPGADGTSRAERGDPGAPRRTDT